MAAPSNLTPSFTEVSDGCSLPSDTICRSIRNLQVLLDFRRELEDRWSLDTVPDVISHIKLSQNLLMDVPSNLTPSAGPSRMFLLDFWKRLVPDVRS